MHEGINPGIRREFEETYGTAAAAKTLVLDGAVRADRAAAGALSVTHGSYCDDLKSGKKTQVEIFLPCKPSDPIPSVIP